MASSPPPELDALVAAHDRADGPDVLRATRRRRVTRVALPDGARAVVREERRRGLRRLAPSRARRAAAAAEALGAAGFSVAEPLGVVERPERSLYLARWVEGPDLQAALADASRAEARRLAVAAAELAARLLAAGFAVRDLKPPNLVVRAADGALVLVDLDDVSRPRARVARYAWRNLAALDAYGQVGPRPLGVTARAAALRAYAAARGLPTRAALGEVLPRSRRKRARLRARGAPG